jgi:hypothetical protein
MKSPTLQTIAAALVASALVLWAIWHPPSGSPRQAGNPLPEPPPQAVLATPTPASPENAPDGLAGGQFGPLATLPDPPKAPEPPARPPNLLPEGVYVATARLSKITDSGVIAIPMGAQVRVLEEFGGGHVRITDGKVTLDADKNKLSDSRSTAEALAQAQRIMDQVAREAATAPVHVAEATVIKPTPQADGVWRAGPGALTTNEQARINHINWQLKVIDEDIQRLDRAHANSNGRISAHGPVITRKRIEQGVLETEKQKIMHAASLRTVR